MIISLLKKGVIFIVTVIVIFNTELNFVPFGVVIHRDSLPPILLSTLYFHLPLLTITLLPYGVTLTMTKLCIRNSVVFFDYAMRFAAIIFIG